MKKQVEELLESKSVELYHILRSYLEQAIGKSSKSGTRHEVWKYGKISAGQYISASDYSLIDSVRETHKLWIQLYDQMILRTSFEVNYFVDKVHEKQGFFNTIKTPYKELVSLKIYSKYTPSIDESDNVIRAHDNWKTKCKDLGVEDDVILIIDNYFTKLYSWIEEGLSSQMSIKSEILNSLRDLDVDSNGIPDALEEFPDLMSLLEENQNEMMETKHIQEIVRLILNLEKRSEVLRDLFAMTRKLSHQEDVVISKLQEMRNNLSLGLTSYQMIMLSTISMITSSIQKKTVQYYREHELLESVGLFQSSWEKEIVQKLENIDDGLLKLIDSIGKMEQNIINSLESNTNRIIGRVGELESSVNSSMSSINSSISLNTFVTGIQAYQTYEMSKKLGS